MSAVPICRPLDRQEIARAFSRAWTKTGNRIAVRIAMMAMTTSSSIRVKARRELARAEVKRNMRSSRSMCKLAPPCRGRRSDRYQSILGGRVWDSGRSEREDTTFGARKARGAKAIGMSRVHGLSGAGRPDTSGAACATGLQEPITHGPPEWPGRLAPDPGHAGIRQAPVPQQHGREAGAVPRRPAATRGAGSMAATTEPVICNVSSIASTRKNMALGLTLTAIVNDRDLAAVRKFRAVDTLGPDLARQQGFVCPRESKLLEQLGHIGEREDPPHTHDVGLSDAACDQ